MPGPVAGLDERPHRGGVDEGHRAEIDPDPALPPPAQRFDIGREMAAIGEVELTGERQLGRDRAFVLVRAERSGDNSFLERKGKATSGDSVSCDCRLEHQPHP